MTKARIIAAMPVGSRWNGFHMQGGIWTPQTGGTRTVEAHRANYAELRRDLDPARAPAILDYPKRKDITDISRDKKSITIGFVNEAGNVWSRIKYERAE